MKLKLFKKIICLGLCLVLLISCVSGCSLYGSDDDADSSASSEKDDNADEQKHPTSTSAFAVKDSDFTMNYDPGASLNPITGTDSNNMLLSSLMYESLFVVDSDFKAQNVLCESYSTTDGKTYIFKIISGVTFHDGSPLTASDVVSTLNWAKNLEKYSSRLADVESISQPDSEGLEIKITLSKVNYDFPLLLDIPIIEYGNIDAVVPGGTGPYKYSDTGASPCLVPHTGYRDSNAYPIPKIHLSQVSNRDISTQFATSLLDFVQYDPTGSDELNVQSDYEQNYYDTSILQYIGFNVYSTTLSEPDIRRAISYAVDRSHIIDDIYSSHVLSAEDVFSPVCAYCPSDTESELDESVTAAMSRIFNSFGLDDTDNDGFLEYPSSDGMLPLSINFIVNEENPYKVQTAEDIAYTLKDIGINITVSPLPWEDYMTALKKGEFDMYLAEARLQSDFDLSSLLKDGGSLNYGHISDEQYSLLIDSFLAAKDETAKSAAAKAISTYLSQTKHIIPILYKQYAIATHRNVITGMIPNQSNLFYNINSWKVNIG